MKHILIIEDNIEIAELERDFLEAADFAVTIAPDGEQGLAALRADGADFALVVLDIMLPGRDGFAICRDIRGQSEVPILIVSAKGEDIDKIRGLGLDAVGDTATVMVHVNRIRSRIEPDPAHPIYIETVWGAGYRFRG